MKGKKKIIINLLVLIVTIGVFYLVKPTKLPVPSKIIIYSEGQQKELDKTNNNFEKIVDLSSKRFKKNLSVAKDKVNDNTIKELKNDGLGIEFLYSESHRMIGVNPFTYDRLYFQLINEKYGNDQGSTANSFQHGDQGHYTEYSRGELSYSKELVDLIESIR